MTHTTQAMQLLPSTDLPADAGTLVLANDADPAQADLTGIHTVVLHFPAFSDGRAFSQAFLLRRRRGFTGHLCATGDVLIDQLQQMQRSGFSQAVLRADQSLAQGERQLARYPAFYQGDVQSAPRFAAPASHALTS
jgi:uncharacterized protein (DUF934 family)